MSRNDHISHQAKNEHISHQCSDDWLIIFKHCYQGLGSPPRLLESLESVYSIHKNPATLGILGCLEIYPKMPEETETPIMLHKYRYKQIQTVSLQGDYAQFWCQDPTDFSSSNSGMGPGANSLSRVVSVLDTLKEQSVHLYT